MEPFHTSELENVAQPKDGEIIVNQLESVSERNPMLNPVVLSLLFELCELEELSRLRLVSRQWYALSLTRFRNEMTVVIYYKSDKEKPQKSLSWENLGNELDVGEKPFRNYLIHQLDVVGHSAQWRQWGHRPYHLLPSKNILASMAQFWGKYGHNIRRLHLKTVSIQCLQSFERLVFEETPNLEKLHLGVIYKEFESQPETGGIVNVQWKMKHLVVDRPALLPISWDRIFLHFPNIQSLEVTPSSDIFPFGLDLERLTVILKPHVKFVVNELSMRLLSPRDIQIATRVLQMPQIILPKFVLVLPIPLRAGEDALEQLLSTTFRLHGKTLKHLILLGDASLNEKFLFHPGPFNCVTRLDFIGNFCASLHFLENFPNLRILRILSAHEKILQDTDSARMERTRLHQLTCFLLNFGNRVSKLTLLSGERMEMLVRLMPKVEICSATLSNASLSVVCREWKQLRRLTIGPQTVIEDGGGIIDDEGITGIASGCEERMPNITDLQDLESLTLPKGSRIGDASIWNGFLKMTKLKYLQVELLSETSDEAFEALRTAYRYGNISITRRRST